MRAAAAGLVVLAGNTATAAETGADLAATKHVGAILPEIRAAEAHRAVPVAVTALA